MSRPTLTISKKPSLILVVSELRSSNKINITSARGTFAYHEIKFCIDICIVSSQGAYTVNDVLVFIISVALACCGMP